VFSLIGREIVAPMMQVSLQPEISTLSGRSQCSGRRYRPRGDELTSSDDGSLGFWAASFAYLLCLWRIALWAVDLIHEHSNHPSGHHERCDRFRSVAVVARAA
jgi:hypothetical protein